MQRFMMKSKLHQAAVTGTKIDYHGSLTVDIDLLKQADILPYEKIQVVNINTGARFETYTIPGPAGSGAMELNGGAARLAQIGDRLIVITYAQVEESELKNWKTKVLLLNEKNKVIETNIM